MKLPEPEAVNPPAPLMLVNKVAGGVAVRFAPVPRTIRVSKPPVRPPQVDDWFRTTVAPAPLRVSGVLAVVETVPSVADAPLLTVSPVKPVSLPVMRKLPPLMVIDPVYVFVPPMATLPVGAPGAFKTRLPVKALLPGSVRLPRAVFSVVAAPKVLLPGNSRLPLVVTAFTPPVKTFAVVTGEPKPAPMDRLATPGLEVPATPAPFTVTRPVKVLLPESVRLALLLTVVVPVTEPGVTALLLMFTAP